MYRILTITCSILVLVVLLALPGAAAVPESVQTVIDNTRPLEHSRSGRLPLLVLPITNSLAGCDDDQARELLVNLDARGIGYTVDWNPGAFENTLAEGLRIGALQQELGMTVSVNANACLYSFFDGSESTLHVNDAGETFAETSFGGTLGCPFALEHRYGPMKERTEMFLRGYKEAGIGIDFIFADWEIDGPIEWNDAWETSKRCRRCRNYLRDIDDFRSFQKQLREIRSEMQRFAFGDNVTAYFPEALVGNYGVYPHNGYRYWYDYFEMEPTQDGVPLLRDDRAPYREWAHEFTGTGYTFAMPVVYTWYPIYNWYNYSESDYRWFYNMLRVASNAGKHTPPSTPLIPFVHWHTTAPPENPDPAVEQFSREKYKELLWHLLLRGHDTFFLWCMGNELAAEIAAVQEVYAESLEYSGFLERGTPVTFDVPKEQGPVVSGLRIGSRVLVKRTEFGDRPEPITVKLNDGATLTVPSGAPLQVMDVAQPKRHTGLLSDAAGRIRFPIGFYELPESDDELLAMAAAGVNIVRCGNNDDLDRAHAADMMGWVSLNVQAGRTDALKGAIDSVKDHPALSVWEGPDEIVWTFTAYSFLEERAGFTREDWNNQIPKAVNYARREGAKITKGIRDGIQLVRERDSRNLPIWINEAADSDVKYVRDYVDSIDITGCDYYAVRSTGTDLQSIGRLVNRWDSIGLGRPVWMVLQAFSWHTIKPERGRLYPSFNESRFMAYNAIVHGSRGVFYWGSTEIDDPAFRTSLYALTSELAAIESYLVAPVVDGVSANVIDDLFDPEGIGVRVMLRKRGSDYLLILVNEDGHRHLGVDLTGLESIDGRTLHLLYGDEAMEVKKGRAVTRLQSYEVKAFSTDRTLESSLEEGRNYDGDGESK